MPSTEPSYTDEAWFLHFITSAKTKANVQTYDGHPIAQVSYCEPKGNGARIAGQFQANVRLMAAAREMLRALKAIAEESTDPGAKDYAKVAIALAEPELFSVTDAGALKFTGTHNECFTYIRNYQGQSVDYALKHGGWKIEPAQGA